MDEKAEPTGRKDAESSLSVIPRGEGINVDAAIETGPEGARVVAGGTGASELKDSAMLAEMAGNS
jgi:hypothetical protein